MNSDANPEAELAAAQAELLQNPNSADNWNRAAIALLKQGKLSTAADYIGHAIALQPEEALNYSNRGRVLFALQRYEAALSDYTKAVELAPEASLYASRSVVNMALGQDGAALMDLNEALDCEPSAQHLLNRAAFFSSKGMAADALRDISQAIELEPADPNHRLARANLAFALARHYPELFQLGLADIDKAMQLDTSGQLKPHLEALAGQLEAHLAANPDQANTRRLIELIRTRK